METNFKFSDGKPYKVVAFCSARFNTETPINILKALVERGDEEKVRFVYFSSCSDLVYGDKNDCGEKAGFDWVQVEYYDAIILMTETFKDQEVCEKLVRRANDADVPVIAIDRYMPGCYNIQFGYGDSFEKIVRHIVEDHHLTRVNFIAGMEGNKFSDDRQEVYYRVLRENNIPIDERRVGYGCFWDIPAMAVVDEFVNSNLPFPQAIICANDSMAIAACQQLKKYGYKVPEDVIVTGFDGIDLERYHTPRLTTCEFNMPALIDTLYDMIHKFSAGEKVKREITIDYRFRISASCGCVPTVMEDASDRIYELATLAKENEYATTDAYQMISELGNKTSLKEVFTGLVTYVNNVNVEDLWICTNEDMTDPDYSFIREVDHFVSPDYKTVHPKMYIPFMKIGGNYSSGETVEAPFLVPHFEDVLAKKRNIMILPLHMEELPIGYIAVCFDSKRFKKHPYYAFVANFMHVLTNFRLAAERENNLNKDQLTTLYNRRGFYSRVKGVLNECISEQTPFSIVSIDMDGLKYINDHFGHKEGDAALKNLSSYMIKSIREEEYAARFGGDEFVIAFGGRDAAVRAEEIKDSIEARIRQFNEKGTKPYQLGASIGLCTMTPKSSTKLDDLIREADDAMYTTKAKHKRESARED